MSNCNAKQFTVDEIINLGYTFLIPDYQRGYRWGETEVVDLLEDIADITDKNDIEEVKRMSESHPYCLQPIAFDTKLEADNKMIVVDGQQRLTTIFLILKYIDEQIRNTPIDLSMIGINDTEKYQRNINLLYEDPTRNESFDSIKNNINVINEDSIDAYYMTCAYQKIQKWASDKFKKNILAVLGFAVKVFYGTTIIWYEIDSETDGTSNDYFSKINTGRIPLTNSELLKANLMLDEYCIRPIDESIIVAGSEEEKSKLIAIQKDMAKIRLENERIKISRQWDEIENHLHDEEFWYFLAETSDKYDDTRIDYIFDIVAKKLYDPNEFECKPYEDFMKFNKERGSFTIIARYLKNNASLKEGDIPVGIKVWNMVWNAYMVFKEWYDDREWYHIIGYLICIKKGHTAKSLYELFTNKRRFASKNQIKKEIIKEIMLSVKAASCIEENIIRRNRDEYIQYISRLSYEKDSIEINNILLLFNVISVFSDSVEGVIRSRDTYFPYARYKLEKWWNLEHIHSKADGEAFNKPIAEEFIRYIGQMLEIMKDDSSDDKAVLELAIETYNNNKDKQLSEGVDENKAIIYAALDSAQFMAEELNSDLSDEMLNGIGNLALLDEKTNKSYKNAPFFMKRMIIGDIVRGKKKGVSRFIPFCTRNVFDKVYTTRPNNMFHWTKNDADDYIEIIANTIVSFFDKYEENNYA